jgi:hypothetical protein
VQLAENIGELHRKKQEFVAAMPVGIALRP